MRLPDVRTMLQERPFPVLTSQLTGPALYHDLATSWDRCMTLEERENLTHYASEMALCLSGILAEVARRDYMIERTRVAFGLPRDIIHPKTEYAEYPRNDASTALSLGFNALIEQQERAGTILPLFAAQVGMVPTPEPVPEPAPEPGPAPIDPIDLTVAPV